MTFTTYQEKLPYGYLITAKDAQKRIIYIRRDTVHKIQVQDHAPGFSRHQQPIFNLLQKEEYASIAGEVLESVDSLADMLYQQVKEELRTEPRTPQA